MTIDAMYQHNLDIIARANEGLAQQISQLPLCNIRLNTNTSGNLVGQLWDVRTQQWVPLCDMHDPVAEAEGDADRFWRPDIKVFCVLGFGLGYFIAALAKKLKPYQRLGVFETSPICYKAAMHAVDMEPLFRRQIDTVLGDNTPQALQQWWLSLQTHEKFHMGQPLRLGFTNVYDAPVYDSLANLCGEMLRYHAVGLATWNQFGRCICDNDLGNMPEYLITPGMQELKDAWQGRAAVCLAAGPSLRKNVMQLAALDVRQRIAILSVGTVYALVEALGLRPDIVTTIDFQRLNWGDQFEHVPLDDAAPLIYLHSTYPATVRRWPGARFVALNASDMTGWMRQFTEPKADAGMVQTVAHLNLMAAIHLGADPIVFLGQDLSMPKGEHHAPGARAQDNPPEQNPDGHVETKDIYGNTVYSRHSLLSMKTVFEQIMAAHPDRTYYNCTEGGVSLAGAADRPLVDVLAEIKERRPMYTVSLRRLAEQIAASYTPATDWTKVSTECLRLKDQVDGIVKEARGWLKQYEIYESARGTRRKKGIPTREELLAFGQAVGSAPIAFSLFAIRRFEVIERSSAIPLPDGSSLKEVEEDQIERLRLIATVITEEADSVVTLIRTMRERVADLKHTEDISDCDLRLRGRYQRQSYNAVANELAAMERRSPYAIKLAYKRQQYRLACALASGITQRYARAAQLRLDRHHAAMQPLIEKYWKDHFLYVLAREASLTAPTATNGSTENVPKIELHAVT